MSDTFSSWYAARPTLEGSPRASRSLFHGTEINRIERPSFFNDSSDYAYPSVDISIPPDQRQVHIFMAVVRFVDAYV